MHRKSMLEEPGLGGRMERSREAGEDGEQCNREEWKYSGLSSQVEDLKLF